VAEEQAIQVNFGKPLPLFPLEGVVALPQQVLPLHIFEPRYRQMIERSLDAAGQIAMAVYANARAADNPIPPLKPAVCVGQIMQHEKLPDGRFNILVQGVCRAKIVREVPRTAPDALYDPDQPPRLFREAILEPIGIDSEAETKLYGVRERLSDLLESGNLVELKNGGWVLERVRDDDIPTAVLLELVAFALPMRRDVKYHLLEEGDAGERAGIVEAELRSLARLVMLSAQQRANEWPKGCSWN
jgi:Lon protease-like protein